MTTLIQLIYAIIIGAIQGISEWLPISSKTQIIVSSTYLFKLTFQQAYTFGLFMEIGTLTAAIIYFRKDLAKLVQVLLGSKDEMERKLFFYVLSVTGDYRFDRRSPISYRRLNNGDCGGHTHAYNWFRSHW